MLNKHSLIFGLSFASDKARSSRSLRDALLAFSSAITRPVTPPAVTFLGFLAPKADRRSQWRARHETINRRFKQFHVLQDVFRHDLTKHQVCFFAVANVTQIMIELGHFY